MRSSTSSGGPFLLEVGETCTLLGHLWSDLNNLSQTHQILLPGGSPKRSAASKESKMEKPKDWDRLPFFGRKWLR
jgi:hypothetical protein